MYALSFLYSDFTWDICELTQCIKFIKVTEDVPISFAYQSSTFQEKLSGIPLVIFANKQVTTCYEFDCFVVTIYIEILIDTFRRIYWMLWVSWRLPRDWICMQSEIGSGKYFPVLQRKALGFRWENALPYFANCFECGWCNWRFFIAYTLLLCVSLEWSSLFRNLAKVWKWEAKRNGYNLPVIFTASYFVCISARLSCWVGVKWSMWTTVDYT